VSISNCKIPKRWKMVIVKMISKKDEKKDDPKNYRPISLTSCLARLCERLILEQMLDHIKINKLIVKKQSGFRAKRQTKDNIISICQRNPEAFNRKKKSCVIFFDISKAFDKVWQHGLIHKLRKVKFKDFIIKWINEFLRNRNFVVKINITNIYYIDSGVPRGGVLSPIQHVKSNLIYLLMTLFSDLLIYLFIEKFIPN
jgi:hypothetical protein